MYEIDLLVKNNSAPYYVKRLLVILFLKEALNENSYMEFFLQEICNIIW